MRSAEVRLVQLKRGVSGPQRGRFRRASVLFRRTVRAHVSLSPSLGHIETVCGERCDVLFVDATLRGEFPWRHALVAELQGSQRSRAPQLKTNKNESFETIQLKGSRQPKRVQWEMIRARTHTRTRTHARTRTHTHTHTHTHTARPVDSGAQVNPSPFILWWWSNFSYIPTKNVVQSRNLSPQGPFLTLA